MLRFTLLATVTMAFASTSHAAPPNAIKPMIEIADTAELCNKLRDGLSATATCKRVSKLVVTGIGDVEVWSAIDQGIVHHAVAIHDGKLYLSEQVEVLLSNCGMMKCDLVDSTKPRSPRVLSTSTPAVAVEIPTESHHEHTADDGTKSRQVIDFRWSEMSIISCGRVKGIPTCALQSWGSRDNTCRVTLAANGSVTAKCTSTDYVPF